MLLNGAMRNHRFCCRNSCRSKDATETGLNVDLKNITLNWLKVRGKQRLATSDPQRPARCSTNVSSAALILRVCLAFGGTVNGRQQNLPSLNGVCICG